MRETTWQKIDQASNCYRFYRIRVEPDLFAAVRITCEWGRIGARSPGRKVFCFETTEEADDFIERHEKIRRRRHYEMLSSLSMAS